MKNLMKILVVALLALTLFIMLVSCDEGDADATTTTTTTADSSTSSSTTAVQKQRCEVKVVDGITGMVLEVKQVTTGRNFNPNGSYDNLHYGYKMNKEKYDADKSQKILKDTVITIEYTPKEEYTVKIQNDDGSSLFEGYEYLFKERLSVQEIIDGKDTLVFGNTSANEKIRTDFKNTTLNGYIKFYEGDSVGALPTAPISVMGEFESWLVVTGAVDGIGGATGDVVFSGAALTDNFVIRPYYKPDGVTLYTTNLTSTFANPLLALNVKDRWDAEEADYTKYNDAKDGNEFVTFGNDTTRCGATSGAFRFVHKHAEVGVYAPDVGNIITPEKNKFIGNENQRKIMVDSNTFVAWDGSKIYVYSIVRDDSVYDISAADIASANSALDRGDGVNLYPAGDNAEIRFAFMPKGEIAKGEREGTFVANGSKEFDNYLRCIQIDSLGRVAIETAPEPTGADSVSQYKYVSVVDLDSESDNRNIVLYNASNERIGYVFGMEFDILGYIQERFVDSGEYTSVAEYWSNNKDMFKVVIGVQVNDRYEPLMTKAQPGQPGTEAGTYLNSDGTVRDDLDGTEPGTAGFSGSGTQTTIKDFSTITVMNKEEE